MMEQIMFGRFMPATVLMINTSSSFFAKAGLLLLVSSLWLHAQLQPEDIYSQTAPSVVTLDVENAEGKHFAGSAFLVFRDGLAVTAWHVVHDARQVEARFSDNQRVTVTGLVDKNENLDLALIALPQTGRACIKISSSPPRIGSRAYLLGAPRNLDFTISEGLIGQIRTLASIRYYQLSCPISPGDSGGPVLNNRGEAIGVVSWRKPDAENIGFAVPGGELATLNAAGTPVPWNNVIATRKLSSKPNAEPTSTSFAGTNAGISTSTNAVATEKDAQRSHPARQ